MTTATLRVVTVDHEFTNNVVLKHDDSNGTTDVTVTDTVITALQTAFDELVTETTIVDLRIFNSGAAPSANYIQSAKTISSAKLDSVQTKVGTTNVTEHTLRFGLI